MKWLGGAVLAAIVCALVWYARFGMHVQTEEEVQRREDANKLRQLAALLVAASRNGILPMKDGALDVIRLVKKGDIVGKDLDLLTSERSGVGPGGEIFHGDYTNFAWERYRGDGRLAGAPFPLLWDKAPDERGGRLVAFSDASVRYCERAEAEWLTCPDRGKLYRIAQALVAISPDGNFPMRDGALDAYAVLAEVGSGVFRSASSEGPTDAEVARGDYTNFPWERCRGAVRRVGEVPLLWEREPNDGGELLVAMADGNVCFLTPERLDAVLRGER